MRKKKTGIKVSRANATSANLTKPSKPKHRGKRLLIICGVLVVLVGLAIAGDGYLIVGDDHLQLPWLEEMYHRECGGKSSSTKKEQVSAEEKCLRPHIERIFGRDAEFGVEFYLCEKDGVNKRSFADLSQAMRICKEKTAGMTEDQMFHSNDGLDHGYDLYIYDPDGQSIKTDDDKARIIKRLKKMVKYLPDGRPDSMWLRYYIKKGYGYSSGSEFMVSASDLSSGQDVDQLIYDFDKNLKHNSVSGGICGPLPYPMERGWHLDKKERAKKRRGCRGASK
ncbi:hypothetical protein [Candidatus Nanoperiomorbus periodonticus]|uniref:hypothetical protein n=1 Tax=Candidatus Nanoperiomorbus periodonticus TaxID=2171989 RepID=UPI00101C7E31|nr:hypothetical protein [Candidatus Nanoperiomorbus periodonticus]RYC76232.1 hypothetical protein G51EAM_00321 [Candidatus Nanoperiomorbus periodonticus]